MNPRPSPADLDPPEEDAVSDRPVAQFEESDFPAKPDLNVASCIEVRYRWVLPWLEKGADDWLFDSGGADGRVLDGCTSPAGALYDVGGAILPVEVTRPRGTGSMDEVADLSMYEEFRVLEGVAGTESVGRPFPMLKGGFACGSEGGGMEEKAASSREAVIPLLTCCFGFVS